MHPIQNVCVSDLFNAFVSEVTIIAQTLTKQFKRTVYFKIEITKGY